MPDHARMIDIQEAQSVEDIDVSSPEYMAQSGDAFTGMIGDYILFCVGRSKLWNRRWVLWAMLSKKAGPYMLEITRATKHLLDLSKDDGRVEAWVRSDFEQGHRWMKILGIPYHHHEEAFLPNGQDADVYVRL
jgi:hypothetical protein